MVDAVIAWVDGQDAEHRRQLSLFSKQDQTSSVREKWRGKSSYSGRFEARERAAIARGTSSVSDLARFRDNGELRYLLRSIEAHAPFIDRIFLLTNGQRPGWLKDNHPGIHLVSHRDIFPDPSVLPTFNSSAIETNLHRIPGLSEEFVYLNDDFFFGSPVSRADFVAADGKYKLFVEADAPMPQTMTDRSLIGHCWAFNNVLISERFGADANRKLFAHTPLLYNRRLLHEVELIWHDEIDGTRSHRLRTPFDAHMRSLYTYYVGNPKQKLRAMGDKAGFGEICALPAADYMFVRFGDERSNYVDDMGKILRQRPKFCCINDEFVPTTAAEAESASQAIRGFLSALFPTPSSFERDEGLPVPPEAAPLTPVAKLRVKSVGMMEEGRVSVWRRGPEDEFFAPHFQQQEQQSPRVEGFIRSGDEIRVDGVGKAGPLELIVAPAGDIDDADPLSGFPPDTSTRITVMPGKDTGLKADDWLGTVARNQSVIDALAARMAPFQGRITHDPMAAFLAADRRIAAGDKDLSLIHLLEQALTGGVEPFWVLHRLALVHLRRGEHYPKAVDAISLSIERNPSGAWIYHDLAAALIARGMYAEGLATADGALLYDKSDRAASYFRSLCRYHFNADDPEAWTLAQDDSPEEHLALWAGIMRRRQQPHSVVLPVLEKAVGTNKSSLGLLVELAIAQQANGQHARALMSVARSLDAASDLEQAVKLGTRCEAEGELSIARMLFDGVRSRAPWMRDVILPWARLTIRQGDDGKHVRSAVDEVMKSGPDVVGASLVKAELMLSDGNRSGALKLAESVAASADPEAILKLAAFAADRSDRALALSLAELCSDRSASAAAFWVEQAIDEKRPQADIESMIATAEKNGVDHLWATTHRVRLLLQADKIDDAAALVSAETRSVKDGSGFLSLAQDFAAKGDHAQGLRIAEAVQSALPEDDTLQLRAATFMLDHGAGLDSGMRDRLDRLVARAANPWHALLQRFRYSLAVGDGWDAANDLNRAEELGGDSEPFYKALEPFHGQPLYAEVMRARQSNAEAESADSDEGA